jgi:hypothetical protein
MDIIFDRIDALKNLDRDFRIFGARTHRYQAQPVSLTTLTSFEEWCGGELPPAYRDFALKVGLGLGPYHGLFPLERIEPELHEIYDSYAEEYGPSANPAGPFEMEERLTAYSERWSTSAPSEVESFEAPWTACGWIPICEQGCDLMTVLVTSGRFRGHVLDTNDLALGGSRWKPARRAPGIIPSGGRTSFDEPFPLLPTFEEWVAGWVDQGLFDLAQD